MLLVKKLRKFNLLDNNWAFYICCFEVFQFKVKESNCVSVTLKNNIIESCILILLQSMFNDNSDDTIVSGNVQNYMTASVGAQTVRVPSHGGRVWPHRHIILIVAEKA